MQIKRIQAEEYELVTGLFDQYRVFYGQPTNISLAEEFIRERLYHNESVIYVAIADDGLPAGFTQLYPLISSVEAFRNWLLNDLYVASAYRKQGIGEALIRAAMEFATSKGASFLQLETAVDNYNARHLYENIGFNLHETGASFLTYRFQLN